MANTAKDSTNSKTGLSKPGGGVRQGGKGRIVRECSSVVGDGGRVYHECSGPVRVRYTRSSRANFATP